MDFKKVIGGLSKSGALSGFMGGVAGGGLTSMMTGKKGRKMGKSALKMGALAAVGGLAWKAYQQYSNNQKAGYSETQTQSDAFRGQSFASPPMSNQPNMGSSQSNARFDFTPARIEQQAFEEVVDDNNESGQMLLMRAMIAAASSDGHIDDNERRKIFGQVETMDLALEEKATLFDELRKPLDLNALVSQVPNAQTGIEVYAASASALDLNQQQSQQYLNALANQLCIPSELTRSIHQQLENYQVSK